MTTRGFGRAACVALALCLPAPALLGPGIARADEPKPVHEATDKALGALADEWLAAAKDAGGKKRLEALCEALVLPDHEAWFKKHWADEKGAALAAAYEKQKARLAGEIADLFRKLVADKRTQVSVVKVEDPADANATGAQKRALQTMSVKTPLYTVRFTEAGSDKGAGGMTLWSFVHDGKDFRLVGKLRELGAK